MKIDDTVPMSTIGVRQERQRRQETGLFAAFVIGSLVLHVGGAVALGAWQNRPRRRVDLASAIPVQLVKLGKPRDAKLLPRKTAPAVAPPPPSDGVALDKGKKDDDKPKKPTPPRRAADEKEATLSKAAERLLAAEALDSALDKLGDEAEGSPDGDPMGTTTDSTNAAAGYYRDVVKALQANYKVPTVIPASQRQFLKARVVLFIERNGRVRDFQFVESHPNKVFMSALERLLKSIVLPPPPAAQAGQVKDTGIEIIFRP